MSMLENIEDEDCPACGGKTLDFDFRLELKPVVAPRDLPILALAGQFRPYIFCRALACPFEKWAMVVGREIWVEM